VAIPRKDVLLALETACDVVRKKVTRESKTTGKKKAGNVVVPT
jgi:hypothetical protein